MRILVIGSGGREHALVWKIAQSPRVSKIFCANGNGGIGEIAECVAIKPDEILKLADFVQKEKIDLTVVGSETPLTMGIADEFKRRGMKLFGPSAKAAQLEGSKIFAKNLMKKYGIPTAAYELFSNADAAKKYITAQGKPCVVKADGLSAGKGAIVCPTVQEALTAVDSIMSAEFGVAGKSIVIEEMMTGDEASIFVITDGKNFVLLPSAQDHKRALDGDKGKNTGGMGSYAPAPVVTDEILTRVKREIIEPTISAMAQEGCLYQGVIYCGIMMTPEGPKVVEFNCRFGDPECQVLMPLIKSDVMDIFLAVCENRLSSLKIDIDNSSAACVIMASGGYPDAYQKGKEIIGLDNSQKKAIVFHAGTEKRDDKFYTTGGRVLGITAVAENLQAAVDLAYARTQEISFENSFYRKDIAHRALKK